MADGTVEHEITAPAAIRRRSGGDTTSLLSAIRETDAHLPPGPIIVYSERAGGAVRCITI